MVRVGTPSSVARPAWYDRNSTTSVGGYQGTGVAPHAATNRLNVVVSSGKKVVAETIQLRVERATAATTAVRPTIYCELTPSGGSATRILEAAIRGNNVGDKDNVSLGQNITLNAGDALTFYTVDGSTGGTCDLSIMIKFTIFDA